MLNREPSVAEVREKVRDTRDKITLPWRDLSAAFENGEEVGPRNMLLSDAENSDIFFSTCGLWACSAKDTILGLQQLSQRIEP